MITKRIYLLLVACAVFSSLTSLFAQPAERRNSDRSRQFPPRGERFNGAFQPGFDRGALMPVIVRVLSREQKEFLREVMEKRRAQNARP